MVLKAKGIVYILHHLSNENIKIHLTYVNRGGIFYLKDVNDLLRCKFRGYMKKKQLMNRTIMREENKQQRKTGKTYISTKQRKELIETVGDSGTILYHHYFDKAAYRNFNLMLDKQTAYELSWPVRKVARERTKLIKEGWVLLHTYSSPINGKFYVTVLGKKAVTDFLDLHGINVTKKGNDTSTSIFKDFVETLNNYNEEDTGMCILKKGE